MSDLTRISTTISKSEKKKLWSGLIVLYLFITTICGLVFFLGTSDSDSVYWPDWYILRLPVSLSAAESEQLLRTAGIDGTLSASSAEVSYMAIPEIQQVAIADLDKVLVPGDPRRDSYLLGVSELFESDGADLIYLPANRKLNEYRRIIQDIPELSSARLMDYQASLNWIPVLIFLGVSLIYTFASSAKNFRFVRIAAIFPLAVLVMISLPGTVFPALLVTALSPTYLLLTKEYRSLFFKIAVGAGFAAASISLILTAGPDNTHPVLVVLSALLFIEFATLVFFRKSIKKRPVQTTRNSAAGRSRSRFLKKRDHDLFEPVSLTAAQAKVSSRRNYYGIAAAAAVMMTILIPQNAVSSHAPIPHASPVSDGFAGFSEMYRLSENQAAGNLPDISGLVSSVSYQEGFLFGASYRLPLPGDRLSILDYDDIGSSISTTESTVIKYDDVWLETLLDRELNSGAGLLYKSLGGPSPVIKVTEAPAVELSKFENLRNILLGIAVLVMLVISFSPVHGDLPVRSKLTPILSARRRAQAA